MNLFDLPEYQFPEVNPTTGSPLRKIWRQTPGGIFERCRMKDLKDQDIFIMLDADGQVEENAFWKADGDAWLEPTHNEYGITASTYMEFDPSLVMVPAQ